MINMREKLGLLKEDDPPIVDNSLKFKLKLSIGDEEYSYLNNAKNLFDFFKAIGAGIGAGSFVGVAWYASLGALSQFALGVGLLTTPVGWLVGASALGAISAYSLTKAGNKFTKKIEKKLYDKIPKYIKTPIDILGLSITSVILPVAVKMAKANSNFCDRERDVICNYLVDGWGFNREFVKESIDAQEKIIGNFDYNEYREALITATKQHKEIKYDVLVKEILYLQNEVMNADGSAGPDELEELARLKNILYQG